MMGIGTGLAIYFLIWWLMVFITIPFRSRPQFETGEVVEGTEAAAPENPQLLKRLVWNTVLSTVVFFLFWLIFYYFDVSVNDLPQVIKIRKLDP